MNSGVILTFGISLLWMKPTIIVYIISGLGAIFQLIAFYILLKGLRFFKEQLLSFFSRFYFQLLKITGLLFFLKLVFQIMGSTPYFAKAISSNVDLIIGYLHWTFLGVVSIALLLFLYQFKLIKLSKKSVLIYLTGFVLTEFFIFYKGIIVWTNLSLTNNYFEYLVIVSCILLIGIFNLFINQFKTK
jgi:hypothetical protein